MAVPAGWRSEVIPFPLDFAPAIHHGGLEDLRFPPGMFDPRSPDYWSYSARTDRRIRIRTSASRRRDIRGSGVAENSYGMTSTS